MKMENDYTPRWAGRTSKSEPEWVDFIPHELWDMGEVFFPIPRGRKGWSYPHHLDSHRYAADSEILNAYMEAGFGYGIACSNNLAVVDIDDLRFTDEITESLPATVWQYSGSREGVHLFYFIEGMDTRVNLHNPVPHDCSNEEHKCFEDSNGICIRITHWEHIGEVKCDPHGYVVGPGSTHPSGNKYGPLNGSEVSIIKEETLMNAVDGFIKPDGDGDMRTRVDDDYDKGRDDETKHDFYNLSADDVLPWLEPENKIAHPIHGSSTGRNFQKNKDRETFTCWRCQYGGGPGCGLNGPQFLAVEETGRDCEDIRKFWYKDSTLHYRAWKRAVSEGLIGYRNVPYKAAHGYAVESSAIDSDKKISGQLYRDVVNSMKYEAQVAERAFE